MMAKKPIGSIDPTAARGTLITPEQIAKGGSEHAHQAAFFQWIALHGSKAMDCTEMLFAVPNGGDRSMSVAASLKAEGVKSGVPDVCWPIVRPQGKGTDTYDWQDVDGRAIFPGLWIELKKPDQQGKKNGGRFDRQVEWHEKLRAQGYAVVLAYGWQSMAWATWLYWTGELRMPTGGDAMIATAVSDPPVVENIANSSDKR